MSPPPPLEEEHAHRFVAHTLDVSIEQIRESLRLRVVGLDSLLTISGLPHLRAVMPAVVEVLAVELDGRVIIPTSHELAGVGSTAEMVALGKENLRAALGRSLAEEQITFSEEASFVVIRRPDEESAASLALVLPSVVSRLSPGHDPARGVAVAIPDQGRLVYRAFDGPSSLTVLADMSRYAIQWHENGEGPVSPKVYWVHGPQYDQWEQLSGREEDKAQIFIPPSLSLLVGED
ncbi:hypothetical protein [Austwickia chelonae]|uniref:Uncharacterized protein n=1 Tax=Austwickia chelonae NBRC 105200 TaxID=1184607 RepID=K6UKN5_9MICO|nr:hypothetical protein [Austwickia chelonae]GAB76546.1 hypothetical protein AUCHE_01_01080 [Austwickia chelonae NBRC 105200]